MKNFLKDKYYLNCNFKEKVAGLINYAQTKLWINVEDPSLFYIIPHYRMAFEFGTHHGDCVQSPRICYCCAYYSVMEVYVNTFPLFLRIEKGNYNDILVKYYNINYEDKAGHLPSKIKSMDKIDAEVTEINNLLKEHNIFEEYKQIMKENLEKIYK